MRQGPDVDKRKKAKNAGRKPLNELEQAATPPASTLKSRQKRFGTGPNIGDG